MSPIGHAVSSVHPGLRIVCEWLDQLRDLMQLAPALGGFALATQLAGALYDRQAAAQDNHSQCKGSLCFRCLHCAHLTSLVHELQSLAV